MSDKQIVFTTKLVEELSEKDSKGFVLGRHEKFWYSNYKNVKKDGISFSMSNDELMEYAKCSFGVINVKYSEIEVNNKIVKDIEADLVDFQNNQKPWQR